ncbi:putative ribonuclease H domain-containing protein [Helianthus debilis subsp. tardiflorus]
MVRYLQQVNSLISSFDSCKIVHIPRSKNKKADALSKLASVAFCHLSKEVLVETLHTPAIQQTDSLRARKLLDDSDHRLLKRRDTPRKQSSGPEVKSKSVAVSDSRWATLSQDLFRSAPKMLDAGGSQLCHKRNPLGNMRYPRRTKDGYS